MHCLHQLLVSSFFYGRKVWNRSISRPHFLLCCKPPTEHFEFLSKVVLCYFAARQTFFFLLPLSVTFPHIPPLCSSLLNFFLVEAKENRLIYSPDWLNRHSSCPLLRLNRHTHIHTYTTTNTFFRLPESFSSDFHILHLDSFFIINMIRIVTRPGGGDESNSLFNFFFILWWSNVSRHTKIWRDWQHNIITFFAVP